MAEKVSRDRGVSQRYYRIIARYGATKPTKPPNPKRKRGKRLKETRSSSQGRKIKQEIPHLFFPHPPKSKIFFIPTKPPKSQEKKERKTLTKKQGIPRRGEKKKKFHKKINRKRQFVHKIFVHNSCDPYPPPPPNQQNDGFPLEFLVKGPQTELRTLSQNCEQTLRKLRTNRIVKKRAFLNYQKTKEKTRKFRRVKIRGAQSSARLSEETFLSQGFLEASAGVSSRVLWGSAEFCSGPRDFPKVVALC